LGKGSGQRREDIPKNKHSNNRMGMTLRELRAERKRKRREKIENEEEEANEKRR
jgi:hypothetical protein